ncbi:hypothetical protein [Solirubrum puertoriconensis]|uniref:Uncharacterized protein n=1 Tax=Solirubrum puertoriconensis TaxID=1751427 RepID=A0A9X0L554_SOLP1|nr:hypothetical protein [Solirubrum puertoriconensis]KUG08328.1 hypothetical protein ASU33_09140 [Solirubrum puertoriconensis]
MYRAVYPWLGLLACTAWPHLGQGQQRVWEAAVSGGGALNVPSPLRIYQREVATLRLRARYRTEPFRPPVYYDVRLATWRGNQGWALRLTHHKIILRNRPPEVQRFSITDGFNLVTLTRLWQRHGFTWAAGAGAVITHPESTVRNKAFPERGGLFGTGYFLSGPVVEVGIAKRYTFAPRWFVQAEARATAAYVRVPIEDGHANVTNLAVHGLLGVGFRISNPATTQVP